MRKASSNSCISTWPDWSKSTSLKMSSTVASVTVKPRSHRRWRNSRTLIVPEPSRSKFLNACRSNCWRLLDTATTTAQNSSNAKVALLSGIVGSNVSNALIVALMVAWSASTKPKASRDLEMRALGNLPLPGGSWSASKVSLTWVSFISSWTSSAAVGSRICCVLPSSSSDSSKRPMSSCSAATGRGRADPEAGLWLSECLGFRTSSKTLLLSASFCCFSRSRLRATRRNFTGSMPSGTSSSLGLWKVFFLLGFMSAYW
mmetsp:Transcript_78780/g.228745  ORF Transcript_78780/g.228745 Transcript_78780/m.228745 type:complete len:259 (-) Transcript_78780:306-1082(-)